MSARNKPKSSWCRYFLFAFVLSFGVFTSTRSPTRDSSVWTDSSCVSFADLSPSRGSSQFSLLEVVVLISLPSEAP